MSSSPNSSSSSDVLEPTGLAALHDVICRVDVILGSAVMSVSECLRLRKNSVVRLSQSAGGDLHVIVNGVSLASGEIVIIDDTTAIRITDILPPPSSEASE